jgi:SWI/SNF-related matrix-associated actin-dependent regulator of chromatin subfamily A member 5
MLRRVKDELQLQLPNRRELTILVTLTERQREVYKQLLLRGTKDCHTIELAGVEGTASEVQNVDVDNNEAESIKEIKKSGSSSSLTRRDTAMESQKASISDMEYRKLMNLLLQLRKVCNHLYLLPNQAPG